MVDASSRVEAAVESHKQYLFGLGVGLGLGPRPDELYRLKQDLPEVQQAELEHGYTYGIRFRMPADAYLKCHKND